MGDDGAAFYAKIRSALRQNATVIAATSAAVSAVTAGYPFDLIKTRMQAFRYPSINHCIREVYQTEGFLGFFTGVGPVVATVSVLRSITFSIYTSCRGHIADFLDTTPQIPNLLKQEQGTLRIATMSLLSGTVAGSVVATLNAPLEFIKVQRQLDALIQKAALQQKSSPSSSSPSPSSSSSSTSTTQHRPPTTSSSPSSRSIHVDVDATLESPNRNVSSPAGGMGEGAAQEAAEKGVVKRTQKGSSFVHPAQPMASNPRPPMSLVQWMYHIVSIRGVSGLFSGYNWHLARDGTGTSLYFCIYEVTKHTLAPTVTSWGVPVQFVHMFSGGFSGTASWLVLFPIDMVKSVIQREALNSNPKYKYGIDFIRHRFRKSGIMGFYRGIGPQLIRSFPIHSLNFLVYEQVLAWCKSL
ncbi:hypothetical protein HDU97_002348 [Phlyctochytrium planicorne]|nr:hypothetical protein HDU97_002348 [Phlyctochytrium planicorne]